MSHQEGIGGMDLELPDKVRADKPSCCSPASGERSSSIIQPAPAFPRLPAGEAHPDRARSMVSLPGGSFAMGTDYPFAFPADGEGPVRTVTVAPFQLDTFPVTNRDFTLFVESTGYRTESEQFGWSFVFWSHIPAARFEELVEDTVAAARWWCKVPGASWSRPEGPGSTIQSRLDHPAVHVSWNDASAYAAWAEKSLPTEAEWEYAARGGLIQKLYPWGDELTPNGEHRCNIWQGQFPLEDTAEDGYAGTSPVDAFPPNGYGLSTITGNVWEWCADWFGTTFPAASVMHNPKGPAAGQTKVMKGGSFLCHASYCNRYRVAARTSNTPDSAASNIGFRCARALPHEPSLP